MTATAGACASSAASKLRPRTSGMPIVWKYSGPTMFVPAWIGRPVRSVALGLDGVSTLSNPSES